MIIFLDQDGVLANWTRSACQLLDLDYKGLIANWPKGAKKINEAAKAIGVDISNNKMWKAIDAAGEDFWANLKPYPWTDELWDLCSRYGEVAILTSPSDKPESAYGKVKWLKRWKGKNFREYFIGSRKYLAAGPNKVLIDDHPKKLNKFKDPEYGGRGILFPQPWNEAFAPGIDRLLYVESALNLLKQQMT